MQRAALVAAPWLVLLAGWYGIHYSGLINPSLVPTPHAVAQRFAELIQTRLPLDIYVSEPSRGLARTFVANLAPGNLGNSALSPVLFAVAAICNAAVAVFI